MTAKSRERPPVGQLLVRLLNQFRQELYDRGQDEDQFTDVRMPHLHIWGSVGTDGIRLTDLAKKTNLSLATCSELITELEELGYVERRTDPTDRRAKLIYPTTEGNDLLRTANKWVADLEARWRAIASPKDFDEALETLATVLDHLEESSGN